MGICYIFGAADGLPQKIEKNRDDIIIAADGGYCFLKEKDITPDIVLGDFDSLGYIPEVNCKIIKHPIKKNDTDTMLAVKTGLDLGFKKFILYGCSGKRLDHTFANIQTLCYITNQGGQGFLCGKDFVVTTVKNGSLKLNKRKCGTVSIFSLTEKSSGVSIDGLLYNLNNATLNSDFPLGVSNEFVGKDVQISVKDGMIAVIWSGEINDIVLE